MDQSTTSIPPIFTQEPVNPEPPKKKSYTWLLILILFLLAVGLSFFAWESYRLRNQLVQVVQPSPTVESLSSADPTAGWKTYTNLTYGFLIKYPGDWTIAENKGAEMPPSEATGLIPEYVLIQSQTVNKVTISINPEGYYGYKPTLSLIEKSIVTVNGQQVEVLSAYDQIRGYEKLFQKFNFQTAPNFSIFVEYFYPEDEETISQIFSTFKFTDGDSISELPKKHFLASDKFFADYEYPAELINLTDNDLIGFSCSNKYSRQIDGSFVFYNNDSGQNQTETLSDQTIISFLNSVEQKAKWLSAQNSLLSAMVCTVDNGKQLVAYEITPGGGGAGSAAYFGYLSGNSLLSTSMVPMENGPYFGCGEILAMTQIGELYVNCGAGDGGFGSQSLYKVNLNYGQNASLLYKCTSIASGQEEEDPTVKCGTNQ